VSAGRRRRLLAEERPQRLHRLLEARPALLEGDPHRVVVALRRTRAEARDDAPPREHVQPGERLREGQRAAQRGQRDRRRELHLTGAIDDAGERDRAVEPRCREEEMVVRGDRREPGVARGVGGRGDPFEREPLAAEVHQRKVHAQLHAGSMSGRR
jgi:hypothetical protein